MLIKTDTQELKELVVVTNLLEDRGIVYHFNPRTNECWEIECVSGIDELSERGELFPLVDALAEIAIISSIYRLTIPYRQYKKAVSGDGECSGVLLKIIFERKKSQKCASHSSI